MREFGLYPALRSSSILANRSTQTHHDLALGALLANFSYSNDLRRGKYARFLGLSIKIYEMKIQPVS